MILTIHFVFFWNEDDAEETKIGELVNYIGYEYTVREFETDEEHDLTDEDVGKVKVLQNVEKFKPDDQEELFD